MSVEFIDNTQQVLSALKSAKKRGLEAIGMTAEGYAAEQLYEGHGLDTGNLKNSISHAVLEDDSVIIGTNTSYAVYVETGHRGFPGYHFLQKAATEHKEEYKSLLESSIRNA